MQAIGTKSPLPFTLLPPCTHGFQPDRARTAASGATCLPVHARSTTWASPLPVQPLPRATTAAIEYACGPLRIHTVQQALRPALQNRSFWSDWMRYSDEGSSDGGGSSLSYAAQQQERCNASLRAFQPRICRLEAAGAGDSVFVAGAAQSMFNASGYFGSARRAATSLSGMAPMQSGSTWEVQARAAHAILSRNEHGSGYYHILFDTLASLAFIWSTIRDDPNASLVFNPCTMGKDHLEGSLRTVAPDMVALQEGDVSASSSTQTGTMEAPPSPPRCTPKPYVTELFNALGVPTSRILAWPYTRQLHGPVLAASRVTFMCSHPFQGGYHRSFWHVRQLRVLLHRAFRLPIRDLVRPREQWRRHRAGDASRLVMLINRRGCTGGCNPTRFVKGSHGLLTALRAALPQDKVVVFDGSESLPEQARLFNRAALIVGPHGAAFANMIWCAAGAAIAEFHRLHWRIEPNSPLYALLARTLQLQYWVVLDTETGNTHTGYDISPEALVATARAALSALGSGSAPIDSSMVVEYPNFLQPDGEHEHDASRR